MFGRGTDDDGCLRGSGRAPNLGVHSGPRRSESRRSIRDLAAAAGGRVKSFLKEDFTPAHVRKAYFWLAPAITMIPAFLTIAVIPFGSRSGQSENGHRGFERRNSLYLRHRFAGVYGIVLAGYASNSKYPFLGGIRSSAQMISYEIAMGMSVIPVFLLVGDLNLSKVIEYQAQHGWLILYAPFCFRHFSGLGFCGNESIAFRFAGIGNGIGGGL